MGAANRTAEGIIFNIQKYSVNDGPGIRTAVFLKGCPLHCPWCSNPESQNPKIQILWNESQCTHCHHCVQVCPSHAIRFKQDKFTIADSLCDGCALCVRECPGQALRLAGEKKTVSQVLDIVLQDLPFYKESGGGLTLSGGEMLAQPLFSKQLLLAAKEENIHTCCETTGYCKPEIFAEVTACSDMLLIDLKHWDSKKHRQVTGVGNELTLKNIRQACEAGKDILPRIPVIPGFNDSLADAVGFSALLHTLGVNSCQLLPFHQFGEKKYAQLGKSYAFQDVSALHKEDLDDYRHIFLQQNIQAFF